MIFLDYILNAQVSRNNLILLGLLFVKSRKNITNAIASAFFYLYSKLKILQPSIFV
jgi:hypothetical protein